MCLVLPVNLNNRKMTFPQFLSEASSGPLVSRQCSYYSLWTSGSAEDRRRKFSAVSLSRFLLLSLIGSLSFCFTYWTFCKTLFFKIYCCSDYSCPSFFPLAHPTPSPHSHTPFPQASLFLKSDFLFLKIWKLLIKAIWQE